MTQPSSAAEETAFIITEHFFWPNRGGARERPDVDQRVLSGFEYRQGYVDSGKARWYLSFGEVCTFTLVMHTSHAEVLEFMHNDPWFGLVKRDIRMVLNASGQADRFRAAIAGVDYESRIAESPLTAGDLTIASLAPDMASRLMDTDCNC